MSSSVYGTRCEAFSIAPDPRFMYLSAQHADALAHLERGLQGGGGFVLLTGEVGAGKTTVWRSFLERLPPHIDVASVVNPKLAVDALLARLCADLGVEIPDAPGWDPIDALHGHLLLAHAQGRSTLIVVDEAQALSDPVLEQLRLLTNLVTSERKLVQVLLIGQPELYDMLERPELKPLAQRIVVRYHLGALPADETRRYIAHRLAVAGASGALPFDDAAIARIHELCGGLPRRINVLCGRALLDGWQAQRSRLDVACIDHAASRVFGRPDRPPPRRPPPGVRAADTTATPDAPAAAPPPPPRRWTLALVGWGALATGLLLATWLPPWLSGKPATAAVAPVAAAPAAAPAAASVPAEPALAGAAELAVWFQQGSDDEAAAWRQLAPLWGAEIAGADPCSQAPSLGLQCYRGRGGLAPIRQLDRPALLALQDAQGRRVQVLLTALGDQVAMLQFGERRLQLPLALLARHWRGEFGTFWRLPPGQRGDSQVLAADGAAGRWLAEQLDAVDPASAARPLADRVFAFQLAQGLAPDGLAGPQTLMQLNRAGGVDEPRLGERR